MSSNLLNTGIPILANLISGHKDTPINGMYVTYGKQSDLVLPSISKQYFDTLLHSADSGYARIAITGSTVQDDGVLFTALATRKDFHGGTISKNTALTTATLVYMPDDNEANDVLVYSALLKGYVSIVDGAYITINVGMKLGE